jgi:hypothetical protein
MVSMVAGDPGVTADFADGRVIGKTIDAACARADNAVFQPGDTLLSAPLQLAIPIEGQIGRLKLGPGYRKCVIVRCFVHR